MSEQINKVEEFYEDLFKASTELTNVGFDSKNPHFKNEYASLAHIYKVTRPILAKYNLMILQPTYLVGSVEEGFWVVRTTLQHRNATPPLMFDYPIRCKDPNDPQKFGQGVTYAKRYGIMAALSFVGDKDDDGNYAATKPPVTPATEAQKARIGKLCGDKNVPVEEVCKSYGIETLDGLTEERAGKAIQRLEKTEKRA